MADKIEYSPAVNEAFNLMVELAKKNRNEYVTPEHLLYSLMQLREVSQAVRSCGGNPLLVIDNLREYINSLDKIPDSADYDNT